MKIRIWHKMGAWNLKIFFPISLGIHLLFLSFAYLLFPDIKIDRLPILHVEVSLFPLMAEEKKLKTPIKVEEKQVEAQIKKGEKKTLPPLPVKIEEENYPISNPPPLPLKDVKKEMKEEEKEVENKETVEEVEKVEALEKVAEAERPEELEKPAELEVTEKVKVEEAEKLEVTEKVKVEEVEKLGVTEKLELTEKLERTEELEKPVELEKAEELEKKPIIESLNVALNPEKVLPVKENQSLESPASILSTLSSSEESKTVAKYQPLSEREVVLTQPRYAENPKPFYPQEARIRGYQGEVVLKVEILSNGRVGQVEVKRSSGHTILDRSALAAVRQWKFIPARKGENPIPFWVNIPIKFQLR